MARRVRRDWRSRGPVPAGSARGEPRRAARRPCSSPATPQHKAPREDSPPSARHPGHGDPTLGNERGEAPGVPRAHENSSRKRCALPPQVASSPASAGGGRGRGHSPLRSPSPGARAPQAAGLPPAPQSHPSEVSSLHLAVPSLSPDFRATLLSLLALRVAGRLMFAMPSRPMTPT